MLRFGPPTGPVVVAAPALFEEGNRTRAFLVRILRLLAERGIAGALPDLPGQGESLPPTEAVTIASLRAAFAAAVEGTGARCAVAIRTGALFDAGAPARWRLSPLTGEELRRDLSRTLRAADGHDRGEGPVTVAGNALGRAFWDDLSIVTPVDDGAPCRTVRLDTDPRAADLKVPGRPLWRASEPDVDEALAAALADDIAAWVPRCVV